MKASDEPKGKQGGHMVEALVDLVQRAYTDDLSPREQLGVVRLEQAWQRRRASHFFSTALGRSTASGRPSALGRRALAVALAAIALVPAAVLLYARYAGVTYHVINGTVGDEGTIRQTHPGTVILFSEGSRIGFDGPARARVASMTAEGGQVVLEDGDARVEIVHRPRAHWTVLAGPYRIQVTGTAFDVRWSPADDRFDCRMAHGSVVINGPLVPDGITLTAGMRLTSRPRGGQLTIGDGATTVAAAGAGPAPRTDPAALLDQTAAPADDVRPIAPAGPVARHRAPRGAAALLHRDPGRRAGTPTPLPDARAGAGDRGWSRQVAQGSFQAVLAGAESEGLDHVIETAPAGDLAALADAARYTHRAATARRALLALRTRLPGAAESRDAAFFLGGLAERDAAAGKGGGDADGAVGWYDQYVRECPTCRFVGEAWGRKMVLTGKGHGEPAARPIAAEYLRRFPDGPYAPAARKLVHTP